MNSHSETFTIRYTLLDKYVCTFQVVKDKNDPRPKTADVYWESEKPDLTITGEIGYVYFWARSDFWQKYCDKYQTYVLVFEDEGLL